MSTFTYQKWKKQESEQRIINALSDGDKSYSELLNLTNLSKPILSERLKSLENKDKIECVPDKKTKRFLYHLKMERLDELEMSLVLLHKFSESVLNYLETLAKDPSISDEEYADRFLDIVYLLFNFRLMETMVAPKPIREELIRNILGSEFVRRTPKLFPKNRNIKQLILNELSSEEQAIYEAKNVKEAGKRLFEILSSLLRKLPSNSLG